MRNPIGVGTESLRWWKASGSLSADDCVEVATTGPLWLVRDTKQNGQGPHLSFSAEQWGAVITGLKGVEVD